MKTTDPRFPITQHMLEQTTLARFIAGANYKRQWSVVLLEDEPEYGLKANAKLDRVEPHPRTPYTAKAFFDINRLADGVPYGFLAPSKGSVTRSILIKQILAAEIVAKYGLNNRLYAGLTEKPASTKLLAAVLNERYDLGLTEEDILDQAIATGASCIILKFDTNSVAFAGSLLVDLFTPVVPASESQP